MSITDELRKFFDRYTMRKDVYDELTAIADRIDAEHERAMAEARAEGMQEGFAADKGPREFLEMPKDADGEYWFCGDKITLPDGNVVEIIGFGGDWLYYRVESVAITTFGRIRAHDNRHYHTPTVEDLLREILFKAHIYDKREMELLPDLIAEYAAKLRLAGDAE
jgi:hypothetical protein